MTEELGPWRQLVQPNVQRLEVGATFDQNVVYNPVGAKAMAELLVIMADKLDGYIYETTAASRLAEQEKAQAEELRREVVRSLKRYPEAHAYHFHHRGLAAHYDNVRFLYEAHRRERSTRTKLSRALARMFGR